MRFIAAGGDVVLTVDANQAGPMTAALLAKAQQDPAFKRLVDAAASASWKRSKYAVY